MKKTVIIIFGLLTLLPFNVYPVQIGGTAPPFELTDLTGNIVRSGDLRGKVLILVFWATWCTQCRTELPELDILYKKYRQDGLEVIGINIDSSPVRLARFLEKIKPSFRVLHDGKGTVADVYHVSGIPVSIVIGRDGVIGRPILGFGKEFLPRYEKAIKEQLKQQLSTN